MNIVFSIHRKEHVDLESHIIVSCGIYMEKMHAKTVFIKTSFGNMAYNAQHDVTYIIKNILMQNVSII